jgi:hypothetical protein
LPEFQLRRWNKDDSVEKSVPIFSELRKQIELIGIEVKGLDEKTETGRLKTSSGCFFSYWKDALFHGHDILTLFL